MSQHFYAGPSLQAAADKPKEKKDPWKEAWIVFGIVNAYVWGLVLLYPLWKLSRALWRSLRYYY